MVLGKCSHFGRKSGPVSYIKWLGDKSSSLEYPHGKEMLHWCQWNWLIIGDYGAFSFVSYFADICKQFPPNL